MCVVVRVLVAVDLDVLRRQLVELLIEIDTARRTIILTLVLDHCVTQNDQRADRFSHMAELRVRVSVFTLPPTEQVTDRCVVIDRCPYAYTAIVVATVLQCAFEHPYSYLS